MFQLVIQYQLHILNSNVRDISGMASCKQTVVSLSFTGDYNITMNQTMQCTFYYEIHKTECLCWWVLLIINNMSTLTYVRTNHYSSYIWVMKSVEISHICHHNCFLASGVWPEHVIMTKINYFSVGIMGVQSIIVRFSMVKSCEIFR